MILCAVFGVVVASLAPEPDWELVVLGIAQDAGIPHLGCNKPPCVDIRAGKRKPEKVACLGLREKASGHSFLFDATPDIVAQLGKLNGGKVPDGTFLTHAHMGHYSGLLYYGRESVGAKMAPVYGSRRMESYLKSNDPWRFLITNANISFRSLEPDRKVELGLGLSITPFLVPHRDEFTDTFGYRIEGPRKKVVFIPDIDRWEKWDRPIRRLAEENDLLFLDGTFSTPEEIGRRDIEEIPHPMIPATRALLRGSKGKVWFIHINHTNEALKKDRDLAREGQVFPI